MPQVEIEKDLSQTLLDDEFIEINKRRINPYYEGPHKIATDKIIESLEKEGQPPSCASNFFDRVNAFSSGEDWPDEKGKNVPPNRIGLAISGGGIRSATFSLGVLQYLSKVKVFPCFDYLSTVSGGGYIGSCITSWYTSFSAVMRHEGQVDQNVSVPKKREGLLGQLCPEYPGDVHGSQKQQGGQRQPSPDPPEEQWPAFPFEHVHSQREPVPLEHLRNFSNYLAPTGDLPDKMRMPALFIRGVLLNFLLILPFFLWAAGVFIWAHNFSLADIEAWIPQVGHIVYQWCECNIGPSFMFSKMIGASVLVTMAVATLINSGDKMNWSNRNRGGRWLGTFLIFFFGVLFVEIQPVALEIYRVLYKSIDKMNLSAGGVLGALGTLSSIFYFFVDLLRDNGGKEGKRSKGLKIFLIILAAIFVPLFFWLLFLYLVDTGLRNWHGVDIVKWYLIAGGAIFLFGSWININRNSLHVFYRDRLSRAYLIKPRGKEWRDLRPQFNDTLRLSAMNCLTAPYHLINAAVNVTKFDDDIGKQDKYPARGRKADFFLFSRHWVGSELTGYCKTTDMEQADPWLNLGTAMAISGAAFSPNMGAFTMGPLSALMTFLNVRLGYWLPNPMGIRCVRSFNREELSIREEKLGFWNRFFFFLAGRGIWNPPRKYLFNEAFRNLSVDEDAFVNLSDGGHIENLGIVPLLKRRCRLIVAIDGEADPEWQFEGLAATIRLARIDLHTFIEIDVNPIKEGDQHMVAGDIWYNGGRKGTLLYIKASMCKTMSDPNLLHFKKCHEKFPHESTLDQFFDEEQFEAYRSLGYHIAKEAFCKPAKRAEQVDSASTVVDQGNDAAIADSGSTTT